jgi:hypothetical protein
MLSTKHTGSKNEMTCTFQAFKSSQLWNTMSSWIMQNTWVELTGLTTS